MDQSSNNRVFADAFLATRAALKSLFRRTQKWMGLPVDCTRTTLNLDVNFIWELETLLCLKGKYLIIIHQSMM